MQNLTDKELVKCYQKGNVASFSELASRHHQRVYRVALLYLYESSLAEDVTQEVFVRAMKGVRGFLFRAEPTTWLHQCVKNVCREVNRKEGRNYPFSNDDQMEPFDHSESTQSIQRIRKLVRHLPERQRDVVVLRVFEELSVEETSQILNCKTGTVKAHLNKAMRNLRKSFSELKEEL